MFSTPKQPQPAPLVPPKKTAPEIESEELRLRNELRRRKGQPGTLFTGGAGLTGPAPVQRKTLLGQ